MFAAGSLYFFSNSATSASNLASSSEFSAWSSAYASAEAYFAQKLA